MAETGLKTYTPKVNVYSGSIQPYMERRTITVPANGTIVAAYNASYFALEISTTSIQVRFSSNTQWIDMVAGQALVLFQDPTTNDINVWDYVSLRNNSGSNIDVTFVSALGNFIDNRLTISGGLQLSPATTRVHNQVTVGTASTLILSASTVRDSAVIRNDPGAPPLYIGDATVTTANGFLLDAGQSIVVNTSGVVHGIRAAGTGIVYFYDERY